MDENGDKEEESDHAKKKLMLFESPLIDHEHPLWTNHLPNRTQTYSIVLSNFPVKNVPTPPPDYFI